MTRQQLCAFFIVTLISLPCVAQNAPPAYTPPAYTQVRWNEDYSHLKDAAKRSDYLDPIKYIPVGDDSYLSLGGQARYRYEFFNNTTFGSGFEDEDGYHLLRFLLHGDLHIGQNFRFFAQGKSALIEDGGIGANGAPRANDADELDVEQAFADLILPFGSNKFTFRFGRQELLYGLQRVIGPADWNNARRTFDGAKAILNTGQNQLDLFWVRPVDIEKETFDDGDQNISLAGAYDTYQLDGLFREKDASKLEVYGLVLNWTTAQFAQNSAGPVQDEDRYTIGARFSTAPKPWDFDVEAAYQFGRFGDGDISAWMVAAVGGYTFQDVALAPRAFVGFDIASGDKDPGDADLQTYNQLFPTAHMFFGYADVIGRQNIIDLHPGIDLQLLSNSKYAKKLSLLSEYHVFWRQDTADALYATGAGAASAPPVTGITRAAGGSDESFVGSELDFMLNWQFDRHFSGYLGYSHFFAGDFIDQTGPSNDIDFLYAAIVYTF